MMISAAVNSFTFTSLRFVIAVKGAGYHWFNCMFLEVGSAKEELGVSRKVKGTHEDCVLILAGFLCDE